MITASSTRSAFALAVLTSSFAAACGPSRLAQPQTVRQSSSAPSSGSAETVDAIRKQTAIENGDPCTDGPLPPAQAAARFELFQKACDGGDEEGCRHLALVYDG